MEWTFVGDKTLKGKEAVRQWMATTYIGLAESVRKVNSVRIFRPKK
jgi:hypothetical protein